MELWESSELLELLEDTEKIEKCLKKTNATSAMTKICKKFNCEMRRGNVNNAMKLLTDNMKNGIFPLSKKH